MRETPNLIVTRSFSKAYSLAGIRFGQQWHGRKSFAIGQGEGLANCDVLSLAAATAAIEDQDYFIAVKAKIVATREDAPALAARFRSDAEPANSSGAADPTGR